MNRRLDGQGAGWTAANSVFWQCTAARIDCFQPPTAQNWAFGNWAQFDGDAYWDMSNEHIQPRSLYYAQLKERLGAAVDGRSFIMPVESEASSSPSIEVAMKLTKQAANPILELTEFIDQASERQKIVTDANGAKNIEQLRPDLRSGDRATGQKREAQTLKSLLAPMMVNNGWLLRGNELVSGGRLTVQWWNGSARSYALDKGRPHITRFVPGRSGNGLTDDLDAMTDSMSKGRMKIIDHNYGLWYDRRRDDHERIRRMDGEVWAPFYELPFARSGQETAWDGLSKYDLSKYNLWYWNRLKKYADLADQKGLVLIHQNYFQHNIIEAGAHYADFPWRTANNINSSGFPEPVPYAGDKRIFLAEQFYDISNPARRELQRAYIRKCLDNFKDNSSVIQMIGAEFTGPLHFVQFWIDTIKEWEKETGKHPIIGLSVTKDVQDAILADKDRAAVIDLIDIRYWHYQADGSAYAPQGGQNLAPRQHARLTKPKKTSFDQVYRAVSEYRTKYPEKAVVYSGDNYDAYDWAIFMGGGSLSNLSNKLFDNTSLSIADLKPLVLNGNPADQFALANPGKSYVLYNSSSAAVKLDLSKAKGSYNVKYINPRTGAVLKAEKIKGGSATEFNKLSSGDEIVFINKL